MSVYAAQTVAAVRRRIEYHRTCSFAGNVVTSGKLTSLARQTHWLDSLSDLTVPSANMNLWRDILVTIS